MQNINLGKEKLLVRTFGEFSVQLGEHEIIKNGNRSKKIWLLIGLLLTNRGKSLTQEKLIEMLWNDADECLEPSNALKNLVYRARLVLEDLSSDNLEYILFSKGAYAWNTEIDCVIDMEDMVWFAKMAKEESADIESRIAFYSQAVNLYKGDFLPNITDAEWIFNQRTYYESLFVNCVVKLCALYRQINQTDKIISMAEYALQFCPFQEDIHSILMHTYIQTAQYTKALAHYESAAETFNRELGVGFSDSIKELYQDIIKGINQPETDLNVIMKSLIENESKKAFFCEIPVFEQICHIQLRSRGRIGSQMLLVLLTVTNKDGDTPPLEQLRTAMGELKEVLSVTLRKSDVVSRYSSSQYIVSLMVLSEQNGKLVTERVRKLFLQRYKNTGVHLLEQIVCFN